MRPEELLKPRYKVIGPYFGSPYKVGDIISFELIHVPIAKYPAPNGDRIVMNATQKDFELYPNIFQPLPWWSDREPEDMPEFVKILESPSLTAQRLNPGDIVRVYKHFSCSQGNYNKNGCQAFGDDFMTYAKCIPVTKEEYEQWKQSNK